MGWKRRTEVRITVWVAVVLGVVVGGLFINKASAEPPTLDQIPPTWSRILEVGERFEELKRWVGKLPYISQQTWGVLDHETGLVWEKAPIQDKKTWYFARGHCANLALGGRKGWRLPSVHEISSVSDLENRGETLALPPGHPFTGVKATLYWSATTDATDSTLAWVVTLGDITAYPIRKTQSIFVWCVRSGHTGAHTY